MHLGFGDLFSLVFEGFIVPLVLTCLFVCVCGPVPAALPCPPNSHYSDCTPPCPPTCADLFPMFCPQPPTQCVEGCMCDAGFVLSDGKCVSLSNCGCVVDGEYHDVSKIACSISLCKHAHAPAHPDTLPLTFIIKATTCT